MPAELRVHPDPEALGAALAGEVLDAYARCDGPFLLGCPGGRSLLTTYRALGALRPELAARAARLVLHGAGKRAAVARLLELESFDPSWPASIVHDHDDAEIWVDREALP